MREIEKEKYTGERWVIKKLACDLCGVEAKGGDWESGCYEVNEVEVQVTVRQKDGSNTPSGGSGEEYLIDLCPKCFKDRLVPWLNSEGANIESREWDW